MKTKKFLLLALILVMVFTFAACGGSSEEPAGEPDETADDQAADGSASDAPTVESALPEGVFVLMNGTEVRVGDNYANIEGKIGDEIQPAERVEPCDPELDTPVINYYFNGVQITTNDEGVIASVLLDERVGDASACDASFGGKVKLGDPIDGVKEILGEPEADNEDDSFLMYYYGDEGDTENIMFYKDEDGNNTMTGVTFSKGSITMAQN